MPKTDAYEAELVAAFDKGTLKSVATKAWLAKFKAATRAAPLKDKRVNIPLFSGDQEDIRIRALKRGTPYR